MPEIREESATFMYVGESAIFMIKPNGNLKWSRLVPATIDDLKEVFHQKKA